MLYLVGLLTCVAIVAAVEWRTDEDLVTLTVIVAASFGAGLLRPHAFWLSGILLGACPAGLNIFTRLTGLRPIYETQAQAVSHGLVYGLSLLVLAVPAVLAAAIGAFASRAFRASRS